MKKNVGSIDKTIRIIIAFVAAYFAKYGEFSNDWISIALYAVAIIMLLTSLLGTCPIYSVLGVNTKK
jgi:low affinity Fe/Cu permease